MQIGALKEYPIPELGNSNPYATLRFFNQVGNTHEQAKVSIMLMDDNESFDACVISEDTACTYLLCPPSLTGRVLAKA